MEPPCPKLTYPAPFLAFVAHFNDGAYRACVEPLEELWFAQRDDFHKALIRLVVGLNQVELGLESGPRFLLTTARTLLEPFHPHQLGLDLEGLDAFIVRRLQQLDRGDRERERFTIVLDPAPEEGYVSGGDSDGE